MSNKPYLRVAVGVILREDGAVLLSSRPADKPWAHWWELAGGKIEPNESVLEALSRELKEELGINITQAQPWVKYLHHYPSGTVELNFYRVTAWEGEPTPLENQKVVWQHPGQPIPLSIGPILPATFPVLSWLRLADRYLLSSIGSTAGIAPWLQRLKDALENGVGLVQFREPAWAAAATTEAVQAEIFEVLQQTVALCDQYGAYCLLNSVHPTEWLPHTDGLHLRSSDAAALVAQQQSAAITEGQLLAVSTHNAAEIALAKQLNCDFVVLGHVLPTPSHPDEEPLGWEVFEALAAEAGRPVFAIGGMADIVGKARSHRDIARSHGGHGIAGIRGIG